MNILKKISALVLVACMLICFVGCGDAYDNFKPAGVYIVDYIGGKEYKYIIDDQKFASEMWEKYEGLIITEDPAAEKGTEYLFFRFYDKDVSTEAVFTIYENGTCCLGRDYETLYKVENGRVAYIELAEMYENCQKLVPAERFEG